MSARVVLVSLLLALIVLAGAPAAAAQPAEGMPARVALTQEEGVWNGESITEGFRDDPPDVVDVWAPPGARIQQVLAVDTLGVETPASWRAAGAEAIRVQVPENTTHVRVAFDFAAGSAFLPDFVAPRAIDRLILVVHPGEGLVVESPDVAFSPAGEGGGAPHQALLNDLQPGERIRMRVVEAGRIGELPVLASVVALSVIGLVAGALYHRWRPPAGGVEPTRLVDHLRELQARLMPPLALFGVLNLVYFTAGMRLVPWRGLVVPALTFGPESSLSARAFHAFAERLVPAGVELVVTRPIDAVFAQVETTLFLAFASTLPLLLYELASFIGPALLPHERRLALRTLPLVSALFLGGALFGLLFMGPLMMRTLYGYAPALGATSLLLLQSLVGFALLILIVFGLAFQLPVIMYALSRFGLVHAATFKRYWRHAVIAIFLLGGLVTPDPTLVSQTMVAIPLTLLYFLGYGVARWGQSAYDAARPA